VPGHESLPSDAQNYQTIVKRIVDTKPDALYYGGGDVVGSHPGLIRKQMADMGFNVPFVGGYDLVTPGFLEDAGTAARGSYGTVPGAKALVLPTAQQFVTDFKARFGKQLTIEGGYLTTEGGYFYAPFAYDATNIIIAAMKRAQAPDRESVRQQIASTKDFKGALGNTSFDQNGDTTLRWVSIFTVQNGDWAWADQVNYQGPLP
jgi:branched-chain amino acid transport system substrate-binding protein